MYNYKAKCTRIIDGDTVEMQVDLGFNVKIFETFRLYGINTNEIKDKNPEFKKRALQAKEYLTSKILGKDCEIKTIKDKKDKYGRYLVNILLDSVDINNQLILLNLAKVYKGIGKR